MGSTPPVTSGLSRTIGTSSNVKPAPNALKYGPRASSPSAAIIGRARCPSVSIGPVAPVAQKALLERRILGEHRLHLRVRTVQAVERRFHRHLVRQLHGPPRTTRRRPHGDTAQGLQRLTLHGCHNE